ncbi:hypothetical protein L3X38_031030 [Prunus dulcis]|uniref:Uncharacterized protein n=1 Tax=Prunus dulcis TaxID=3755 RepID=A0AAD4VCF0_PRUDU|nr:hypothetical protein L3X38_031030 [Prunus dulcis]
MEQEQQLSTRWEGYVDWRNRAAIRGRHGGMLAASFVLVEEILENLAYLANASNLVLYLSKYMHLSPSKAANNVTDFMGTAFLLALLKPVSKIASAVGLLDAALAISPRLEQALELKARSLLYLRRFKDVADMLQDYIPSLKMASDDSASDSSSQPLQSTKATRGAHQLTHHRSHSVETEDLLAKSYDEQETPIMEALLAKLFWHHFDQGTVVAVEKDI